MICKWMSSAAQRTAVKEQVQMRMALYNIFSLLFGLSHGTIFKLDIHSRRQALCKLACQK